MIRNGILFILMVLIGQTLHSQNPQAARDYEQAVVLFNSRQYLKSDSLFTSSLKLEPHPDSYYSRAICRKKLGLDSLYCRDLCSASLLKDQESANLFRKDCGQTDTAYWTESGTATNKLNHTYYTVHYFFKGSSLVTMAKFNKKRHIIYVHSYDTVCAAIDHAEVPAEFKGGTTALYKYVTGQLKVPEDFHQSGRNGTAKVRFLINKDGRVLETEIKEGIPGCAECEKEALRLIQHMPPWHPARSGGKNVSMYFVLPIRFR